MWFREADVAAGARSRRVSGRAALLAAAILAACSGGVAFAGSVEPGNDQPKVDSHITMTPAPPRAPGEPSAVPTILPPTPAPSVHAQTSLPPASLTTRAAFADDAGRTPLLDATPLPASEQPSLPTVQALAAATDGTLNPTLVFDAPAADADDTDAAQTLIPLPPAGWTGMAGLVSLGVVGKLRRMRRRLW